jgi:hypothetical protein
MLSFKEITHEEAIAWLENNNLFDTRLHRSFKFWIRHVISCKQKFPMLEKFYKTTPRWLAAYLQGEIVAIHFFTIHSREMFDGYLIRLPDLKGLNIGLKLGNELFNHTKHEWDINWSTCEEKYVEINRDMGYQIENDYFQLADIKIYLLCRKPS